MTRKLSLYSTCTGYIEFHWWEYPCKLIKSWQSNSPLLYINFTTQEIYLHFRGVFSRANACDKLCRRCREFWWALLKTPQMCILSYQILSNERLLQLLIRNLGGENYIHVKISFCEIKLMYSISQSKRDNMLFEANCLP